MPEQILKFSKANADIFVPDGTKMEAALGRITHLGIGAHQDDLEIMALDGILKCFDRSAAWFGGITCTSGSGSTRTGKYLNYTNEEMVAVRREEQRSAAVLGQYGIMIQLGYESGEIRGQEQSHLEQELNFILTKCCPQVIYTHNPADKHGTHVAVFLATLKAVRSLPHEKRPKLFYGCESWRDLDWMPDSSKVIFDVSGNDSFAERLVGVYDSQIAGGKNYNEAIMGRRAANATFSDPYDLDRATRASLAMDLTPLIKDDKLEVISYVTKLIDEFKKEVTINLETSNTRSK